MNMKELSNTTSRIYQFTKKHPDCISACFMHDLIKDKVCYTCECNTCPTYVTNRTYRLLNQCK